MHRSDRENTRKITMKIEINDQFKQALDIIENTSKNIFITGKAGTGKSTLLKYFRSNTRKAVVVLAPTGVAAVNVRGQTIHSFFRFKPDITPDGVTKFKGDGDTYKKIDCIVIDEVSMVRADLLDCVNRFLKLNGKNSHAPFGGIQMIFIGDLYQLPPVVTGNERKIFRENYASPWFFDAKVFDSFEMEFVELEKVYRQKDQDFINLLNAIRNNSATEKELGILNKRLDPEFTSKPRDNFVYLTTTNKLVKEINDQQLSKLKGKRLHYEAKIKGDVSDSTFPADIDLCIKKGAQVMLVNNDSSGRWINGSIGKILDVEPDDDGKKDVIYLKLSDGSVVDVLPNKWDIIDFKWNKDSQNLESEIIGTFTQYPLKLAWAVTIHKSQGKTFDKVILDIDKGTFASGQLYVALSRCTTLEGIVLKRPIQKKHILMDWKVVQFVTRYQYKLSDSMCSLDKKIRIIERAVSNRFKLDIVYLKTNDEKSRRTVQPEFVGEMKYNGKSFIGMEGFDSKRRESRVFRVDRILELHES